MYRRRLFVRASAAFAGAAAASSFVRESASEGLCEAAGKERGTDRGKDRGKTLSLVEQLTKVPPFDPHGSRYDMQTYGGRCLHFFSVIGDLSTLATTQTATTHTACSEQAEPPTQGSWASTSYLLWATCQSARSSRFISSSGLATSVVYACGHTPRSASNPRPWYTGRLLACVSPACPRALTRL